LTRRPQCLPIIGDPPTLSLDVPKGASVTTAWGVFDNFVTAPVPEPSTWTMMLVGFAGLAFAGYRRSRRAASIAV
jgi:PEP-CTERM motif